MTCIPIMQVRDKSILIYSQQQERFAKHPNNLRRANMVLQREKKYSGKLSPSAKKRLAKAVTLLVQSSKKSWLYNEVTKRNHLHQLSFITLTVSDHQQKLTGKEAYQKLLSHFLQWLRRTKQVNTYIWKAELQKNGQIHYHITTPAFINYQEIKDKWNNLQKKAGLLTKYFDIKGHYNANSTDVHEVRDVENLSGYLLKYITKSSQNEESLGGKVWDCSENLKTSKYFSVEANQHHEQFLTIAVDNGLATEYRAERFIIYKFKERPEEHLLTKSEYKQFKEFLTVIRNYKHTPTQRKKKTKSDDITSLNIHYLK